MNRLPWSVSLSVRMLLLLVLAITVPGALVAVLAIDSSNRTNVANLQAFVKENGESRSNVIEDQFEQTLNLLTTFRTVTADQNVLQVLLAVIADETSSTTIIDRFTKPARSVLETGLVRNALGLIESAWLLTPDGEVVVDAVAEGKSLPFNRLSPQENLSDAYRAAQSLTESDQARVLVVANRNGVVNLEIVDILRLVNGDIAGYLVSDLDLNTIILRNLINTAPQYDLISFVVMPDDVSTLQLLDTRTRRLASVNSVAVDRALDGQSAGVAVYNTGDTGERNVIGFYDTITVLGVRFALITELDQSAIYSQRLAYGAQVSLPVAIAVIGLLIVLTLLATQAIVPPLMALREATIALTNGDFTLPLEAVGRPDEIGSVTVAFVDMRHQVQQLINDMEARLAERTRDVRITQDIGRVALAERDVEVLLTRVVDLIVERFPSIYHAQVFLVDANREYAVLRASTGSAGQELLRRGHRLRVGSVSVIGQVTEQGQTVVARDISASNVHRQNEFLPNTEAELAIPLVLGTLVLGALDVQTTERDSFTPDQITTLQTLADQITIAIENARLYAESQRLIASLEEQQALRIRRAWGDYLNAQRLPMLTAHAGYVTGEALQILRETALTSGQTQVGSKTSRQTIPFVVPIRVRGQVLGVVEYEIRQDEFSYNKVLLAEELVSRLALGLDNARLFQESTQTAQRERLVNDISARLTSQTDVQSIVETALREVSIALGTPEVAIHFALEVNTQRNQPLSNTAHQPMPISQPEPTEGAD